jgi:transposase
MRAPSGLVPAISTAIFVAIAATTSCGVIFYTPDAGYERMREAMTIDPELESRILRYHFVERWRVNTIARQLGVHHSTVSRVLSQAGIGKGEYARRPSILDDYTPMILETLAQFPTLSAQRLYVMAQERGFAGSESHFRAHVAQLRPRPVAEAYLRLKTLPGEQAQVDWGHFGEITIGRAKRPLMAFVLVLSWSRRIFLRFYLNQKLDNFIRGHVEAFEKNHGISRIILYDNLKAAVLERRGKAIRFHPTLLELSAHYRFEPRPVSPARGNEKGRVERAIRYIRDNFFAGRHWRHLDDLNRQADHWCETISGERRCPQDPLLSVNQAFEQEQPKLIALPEYRFGTEETVAVRIGKTPYARFDRNDYSVPPDCVRRTLTVRASLERVRIFDADALAAEHARSFDAGAQIEDPRHIEQLLEYKREGRLHRGYDRLTLAVPQTAQLIELAAAHALPITPLVSALSRLLDQYGAAEMQLAVDEALAQDRPSASAVQQVLERRREQQQNPPPLPVALPTAIREYAVRPADLAEYDHLHTENADDSSDDDPETTP